MNKFAEESEEFWKMMQKNGVGYQSILEMNAALDSYNKKIGGSGYVNNKCESCN
jgi:hypothetical protein